MRTHLARRRVAGQSIPLIAFIVTTLFGMVGLSVDVGNTYAQQRAANRATDAAAIAGMNTLIRNGSSNTAGADKAVADAIEASYRSNGIDVVNTGEESVASEGQRNLRAYYLDSKGNPLLTCQIGSCGTVPTGTTYIQLKLDGEVPTYFARVVGRPTLPVNAQSFAQRCSPSQGVYPISVPITEIDANGFTPPDNADERQFYKVYSETSDGTTKTYTQRRFYALPMNNADYMNSSYFSFVRWTAPESGNSATNLATALTGEGTLRQGFDEVPWPNVNNQTKPAAYPLEPNVLSQGDWIYGNPWWSNSTEIKTALDSFISTRKQLILPVVQAVANPGAKPYYQFSHYGRFYLVGYNEGGLGNQNNQIDRGRFLDLVYIGAASSVACLPTNMTSTVNGTPSTPRDLAVSGAVFLKPRWTTATAPSQPIQYVFVFDFSGSMNWNFPGWAGQTGSASQCEQFIPGAKDDLGNVVPDRTGNCPGNWNVATERRVMVARNAVSAFVDKMNQYDTARIVGYAMNGSSFDNGNDVFNTKQPGASDSNNYFYRGQLYRYAWAYPPENAITFTGAGFVPPGGWLAGDPGWTLDKAVLKKWISVAGPTNNPAVASGGTPGANGVKLARALLDNAPKTAPNGQTYKKVIIYMTDGVANVFLDGTSPHSSVAAQNRNNVACTDIANGSDMIPNTPRCQINAPNVTYPSGWNTSVRLPITAMTDQTDTMKAQYRANGTNLMIFSMAIGATTGTGLDVMASEPSLAYVVNNPNAVTSIFDRINIIAEGSCQANSGVWISKIAPSARPDPAAFAAPNNIDPANKIYGYVYLYDKFGNPLSGGRSKLPITEDSQGNLTWGLPAGQGLTPGQYQLEAFIGYKTEDNVTRSYDWAIDRSQSVGSRTTSFEVTESDALGTGVVVPPLYLDLSPDKKLCP